MHGDEFCFNEFDKFCKDYDNWRQLTTNYTSQENGWHIGKIEVLWRWLRVC